MKKIILILFLVPLLSSAQENVTNLQLKGRTVKIICALIYGNADTSLGNTFQKWREDYIDGSVPNDNANVTISTTKTTSIISIYSLLLILPAGYTEAEGLLTDFKTSIVSQRATNPTLDAGCTALETQMSNGLTALKATGLNYLLLK